MSRIFTRLSAGLVAAAAATGLALAGALPAGAANIPPGHFSNHLAGHLMEGNGIQAFGNIQGQITVPSENSLVPPDQVAQGFALGQNVSAGGAVYALAAVYNDNRPPGTGAGQQNDGAGVPCAAGQWTVEFGNNPSATSSPQPVPVPALQPLISFGNPICLSGGGTEFLRIYHSTHAGIIDFLAGPNVADTDVLHQDFGVFVPFRAPAEGITTSTGTAAGLLTLGNSFEFGPVTVQVLANGSPGAPSFNTAFGKAPENYSIFEGTVTGTPPSVLNPITLTPVWTGPGSANAVLVP